MNCVSATWTSSGRWAFSTYGNFSDGSRWANGSEANQSWLGPGNISSGRPISYSFHRTEPVEKPQDINCFQPCHCLLLFWNHVTSLCFPQQLVGGRLAFIGTGYFCPILHSKCCIHFFFKKNISKNSVALAFHLHQTQSILQHVYHVYSV